MCIYIIQEHGDDRHPCIPKISTNVWVLFCDFSPPYEVMKQTLIICDLFLHKWYMIISSEYMIV
jgi:hypothetical protein